MVCGRVVGQRGVTDQKQKRNVRAGPDSAAGVLRAPRRTEKEFIVVVAVRSALAGRGDAARVGHHEERVGVLLAVFSGLFLGFGRKRNLRAVMGVELGGEA